MNLRAILLVVWAAFFSSISWGQITPPTNLLSDGTYGLNTPAVVLTWDDNSTTETDYEIQRATDAAFTMGLQTFNLGAANPGATATYTDNTVVSGALYFYRVRTVEGAFTSVYGNTITSVPVVEAGNTASFDAASEFVDVSPSIQNRTEWTFTCWFNGRGYIYSEGSPANRFYIEATNRVRVQALNGVWVGFDAPYLNGEWNFLAISLTGGGVNTGTLTMVVNNTVQVGTLQSASGSLINAVFGKNVGDAFGGQPAFEFTGEIDEASIWSRALTSTEMLALRDKDIVPGDPDLVSLWHFDEPNSSTTVYDVSGNDNHGVRTNNPLQVTSKAVHPFAPENFKVIPRNGKAELQWDPSYVIDFQRYNISYKLNSDILYMTLQEPVVVNNSVTIPGLTNGELYDFKVNVTDDVDQEGVETIVNKEVPQLSAGNAASFDGTNSTITVPDNAIFDRNSGLTLEAWIRPDNLNNSNQFIAGVNNAFRLSIDVNDRIEFLTNDGGGAVTGTDPAALLTQGQWAHVAMTFQGTTANLYLNGSLVHQNTSMPIPQNSTQAFTMGATAGGSNFFNGLIDEVRLWDQEVDQATLQANMFTPLRGDETNMGTFSANLIGLWHCDEPTSYPTAHSTPSNEFNGTLSGNADFVLSGAMEIGGVVACDYNALVSLYNATDGPNWTINTDWLTAAPVSTWFGVIVSGNRVVEVDLQSNNLNGFIPPDVDCMDALTNLELNDNLISGSIPVELGNLTSLTNLELQGNLITGSIPVELGNLTGLIKLDLNSNQLTGSIPVELGNLTNLTIRLHLGDNQLTGSIPTELGNLVNVTSLQLDGNQLSGSIPTELGDLISMIDMNLGNNQLSGIIPVELGNLINVTGLTLWDNQLTGTIPVILGSLTNLTDLNLDRNLLTGSIPIELGNLINLQVLTLWDNQLTGPIPVEFGNLTNLIELEMHNNQLSGSIPTELGNLINLNLLWIYNNQLSGSIPVEIGALTNLINLWINLNQLTGPIPVELENLINLTSIDLSSNLLSGSIPSELSNLNNLIELYLWGNLLTGSVPFQLQTLTNLTDFVVYDNLLVDLPDFSSIASLNIFEVENNNFHFDDIEPNVGITGAVYSPQNQIPGPGTVDLIEGDQLTLSIPVGGSANQYQWMKDGTDISGETTDNLVISSTVPADAGIYSLRITSTLVAGLTLQSENIVVNITTLSNSPPVASTTANPLKYTENDAPTVIDNTISIADSDNTDLISARISISMNYVDGEDVLAFTDQNGITGSFDSNGGVLDLSGTATIAEYQTALQSITYENLSDDPNTLDRQIRFRVNDGTDNSNNLNLDVQVTPVNDPPEVTTTVSSFTYTIGGGPVVIDPGVTVTDVDDNQMESAEIGISNNYVIGEDILGFTDQNGITGSFDASNGIMSLSGTAGISNYQSALRSVTYENISEEPTTIIRTIGFSVNDGADNSPVSNTQNEIEIDVIPGEIVVYNAVSPNGDGKHDFLEIVNITSFPNNQVKIFNRWGDMVYEVKGYDNGNKAFKGVSNLGGKNELPEGTFYYSINLNDGSNTISGFLVLNR